MTTDPVCKMIVSEEKSAFKSEYNGKTYWFCGAGCKERFDKDPDRYLGDKPADWVKGQ